MKWDEINLIYKMNHQNILKGMDFASIDEFDPIPAIEHWNVADVR